MKTLHQEFIRSSKEIHPLRLRNGLAQTPNFELFCLRFRRTSSGADMGKQTYADKGYASCISQWYALSSDDACDDTDDHAATISNHSHDSNNSRVANDDVRPISVLIFWISAGLTQA